jgi:hypothetical protein
VSLIAVEAQRGGAEINCLNFNSLLMCLVLCSALEAKLAAAEAERAALSEKLAAQEAGNQKANAELKNKLQALQRERGMMEGALEAENEAVMHRLGRQLQVVQASASAVEKAAKEGLTNISTAVEEAFELVPPQVSVLQGAKTSIMTAITTAVQALKEAQQQHVPAHGSPSMGGLAAIRSGSTGSGGAGGAGGLSPVLSGRPRLGSESGPFPRSPVSPLIINGPGPSTGTIGSRERARSPLSRGPSSSSTIDR